MMSKYNKAIIYFADETQIKYTIGEMGVKEIRENEWSPEPYCGVLYVEILFDDGSIKGWNKASVQGFEMITITPPEKE